MWQVTSATRRDVYNRNHGGASYIFLCCQTGLFDVSGKQAFQWGFNVDFASMVFICNCNNQVEINHLSVFLNCRSVLLASLLGDWVGGGGSLLVCFNALDSIQIHTWMIDAVNGRSLEDKYHLSVETLCPAQYALFLTRDILTLFQCTYYRM